jgi:PAS domain S-box-containing protein
LSSPQSVGSSPQSPGGPEFPGSPATALVEARFRAAVAAVNGVLWTNNAAGEMEGEQAAWAALTGQTYDEYRGYGWAKAVHPDDAQPTLDAWKDAVAARRTFDFEHRVLRHDGQWRLFAIRAVPVLNDDGSVREWVGVHTDITDRRRAEDRASFLRGLADRLRDISDPRSIMAAAAEALGRHLNVGRCGYGEVQGTTSVVTVERDWSDGSMPSAAGLYDLENYGRELVAELRAGRSVRVNDVQSDLRMTPDAATAHVALGGMRASLVLPLLKSGRFAALLYVHQTSPRVWTDDDEGIVHEVAERTWAAVERARAENALRERDRRKDEFLATLAHELRNPLAPIRQAVRIARAPQVTDAQLRWSHDVIERQATHMSLLLGDLLDASRVTEGKLELRKEPVELAAIIDTAIETARPLIDARRQQLNVTLPSKPVALQVDALRLAQVVANLLTNAAKYSNRDGSIELCASLERDGVVIRVRDAGIGIEREMLPRVFDMFSQATSAIDRSEGGLGIGLAIVKGIVELHGGRVEARSEGSGKGSEFIVDLPNSLAPTQTPAAQSDELPGTGSGQSIVIADDNRDSAESLKMLLELDGHSVRTAHDGASAFELVQAVRPRVALLDIGMPKLNGYELASKIRAQPWGASITLVAFTGWGQSQDRQRALEAGFDHHLTKPVDHEAVLSILRKAQA